jgi:protein O-GlcNAc transferase
MGVSRLEADLQNAVTLHQRGRLTQAEQIYLNILKAAPDHFDALHLLGVLRHQQNRNSDALELISAALQKKPNEVRALSNYGVVLGELKRFDEAVASYHKMIALKPDYAEGYYNLGIVFNELRRFDEALASYDKAVALKPDYAEAFNSRGLTLSELIRFNEALVSFGKAIILKPDYAEAFNNQGNTLRALNRFDEALASYGKAIALKPDYAEAFNNQGNALKELNRLDEALSSYDKAISLKPNNPSAYFNRGIALKELGCLERALASYNEAISLKPDYAEALYNRGNVLNDLKRFDEALANYDKAVAFKPSYAEAFNNQGVTLSELARFNEALASYGKAISLKPDYGEAFNNQGNALRELNRFDEALASCGRAIALKPDYAEAHYNLGVALSEQGRRAEAVMHFERALALKSNYAEAKLALCMAQLAILYMEEPEIAGRRAAYKERLEALCNDVDRRTTSSDLAEAIGSSQPFLLAYQGHNDRHLQSLYGSLVCRIMAKRYPPTALSSPPRSDEPVRLGIVSGFFQNHSNWQVPIRGWLTQIDRRQFRVFGYYTGVKKDAETEQAIAHCHRFVQGPLSIERWRETIRDDAPHVLIYPEVGMDPVSAQLAAQRLAPIQCNSWGHPDTSGFPTLDYYLSSELMEPQGAQEHYTERLVRLPNLSIYYEPVGLPPPVSLNRADLGLSSTATIYWSGQSLFKYLPQFDQVFPRIAREVGECQFVFIQFQRGTYLNERFSQRLDKAFAAFGLRATDYCVLLPRLDVRRFMAAIGQCDIVLDSIGWSGCNSTLESLQHNLPIVTMTGSLMRGRHTTAILKMMGVNETIASTVDDYVSTAIRLARDVSWRMAFKNKISENKHRVYRDTACVLALEDFLNRTTRGESSGHRLPVD